VCTERDVLILCDPHCALACLAMPRRATVRRPNTCPRLRFIPSSSTPLPPPLYLRPPAAPAVLNTLWFYQITTGLLKAVGIMKPAVKKAKKHALEEAAQPAEVKKTQ